jgi:hypothetical protein
LVVSVDAGTVLSADVGMFVILHILKYQCSFLIV